MHFSLFLRRIPLMGVAEWVGGLAGVGQRSPEAGGGGQRDNCPTLTS